MENLTKEIVSQWWFIDGIEDFFFAFQIESYRYQLKYRPFFYAMGFEKICKACLLAQSSSEYKNLEYKEAEKKIDSLAKGYRHNLNRIVAEIQRSVGQKIRNIKANNFDGYTGEQLIEVMQAACFECGYLLPREKQISKKFPVNEESDMYWYPLASSGIEKFCFAFARLIFVELKEKFDISISKAEFDKRVVGEAGRRFCNCLNIDKSY